jgi:hypothetical protein
MDGYDLKMALIPRMVVITKSGCFLDRNQLSIILPPVNWNNSPDPNTKPTDVYQQVQLEHT